MSPVISEGRRKRQVSLRATYGSLYTEVSRLLREEVSTILPRLREAKSPDDVQRIVHEEFVHWFTAEIAGSAAKYAHVSKNIWKAWNKFPASG